HNCKYFNIWIYDNLFKELVNLNRPKSTFVQSKITEFWKLYNVTNECKWQFPSCTNNKVYVKLKELYDYALNYKILDHYLNSQKDPCIQKLQEYLQKSINLYNLVKSEYKSNKIKHPCKAYYDIREIYGNKKIAQLQCNNVISDNEAYSVIAGKLQKQQEGADYKEIITQEIAMENSHSHGSGFDLGDKQYVSSHTNSYSSMAITLTLLGTLFIFFFLHRIRFP
ncbi:PIR Superfamily Protein, partial [Plasmodium ovale curtisi]